MNNGLRGSHQNDILNKYENHYIAFRLNSEILQAFQKEFLHVEKAASSEKSSSDAVVKDAVEKIYYDSGSQQKRQSLL